jgi:hypothetical protein
MNAIGIGEVLQWHFDGLGRPEHRLLLPAQEMEDALSWLFSAAWPLAILSMVCNYAYRVL